MKYLYPTRSLSQKGLKSSPSKNNGLVLLTTVLALMVIVGLLTMSASKITILETKMVFNMQEKQRSLLAADSAAQYAWGEVNTGLDITQIINNTNHPSFYVIGDKIPNTSKNNTAWNSINDVMSWPWDDETKRQPLPEQLGGNTNPMKLVSNPQYTIGIHNPILRKGTANYYCNPVTIIGASQGGTQQTRTLIEMKTIPSNTCHHEIVK